MKTTKHSSWPVLKKYDQDHLLRIALPLGGIGTGTVSLSGRGALRDWEIMNRPAKGFTPQFQFAGSFTYGPSFVLYAKPAGKPAITRLLEGPLPTEDYEGARGSRAINHSLPRFRECSFAAAYPLGQVHLRDADFPIEARLEAFNPFIPGDADASGIPVAVMRYVLTNRTAKPVTASLCGTLPNFIGMDGSQTTREWTADEYPSGAKQNVNTIKANKRLQGIFMSSNGVDPKAEQWGTMALATTARGRITMRRSWAKFIWGDSLLDFWDDFTADGELEDRDAEGADMPTGSVAVKFTLAPHATREVTFFITWHFPNRPSWTSETNENIHVGNYYATQYRDAWDVAEKMAAQLPKLEAKTVEFVRAFCDSDLPPVLKEAALFNLSTLRTQTCFRTEDGRFFGWEGCHDKMGSCHGNCNHVWNYDQATPFLFGDLARTVRDTDFNYATNDKGLMSFRTNLPLEKESTFGLAAADGQTGTLMKLYREWQLSGDDAWLKKLWPKARKALGFAWIPGGWDADRDGVMEGCQHNSMDVEYLSPNLQCTAWYLAGLRSMAEMARHLGDTTFAEECQLLFERGSQWVDEHLFNGHYYEQEIRPIADPSKIAPGLAMGLGAKNLKDPELQVGSGCFVDQLAGQFVALVCGLGYIVEREHVATTLRSIFEYNFKIGFHDHFSHCRTFITGDETGLLMGTFPLGRRPVRPVPYYNEVMTGFEYCVIASMLYEGQTKAALKCATAIRDRYDGLKRNPFNEAECGYHYARAMASWASVIAWPGFHYSAVIKTLTFAPKPGTWFWSNGYAWGTCRIQRKGRTHELTLNVMHGELAVQHVELPESGRVDLNKVAQIKGVRKFRVEC